MRSNALLSRADRRVAVSIRRSARPDAV